MSNIETAWMLLKSELPFTSGGSHSKAKSVNDFIGYRLYPKTAINAYLAVDSNGNGVNKVRALQPGVLAGHIYSWVLRNGEIWWMLDHNITSYKYIFVKHKQGLFDYKPPIFTPIPKSPNTESFSEALLGKIGSFAKYAVIIYVGVKIVETVLTAEINKPKTKKVLT